MSGETKLPAEDYIKNLQMPICTYVIFMLLSLFAIGLLIFLWLIVYPLGNQYVFIITSLFIGITIVFIIAFTVINLIFSEDDRKQALLTYAYDEALKRLEDDRDVNFLKLSQDIDKKKQQPQVQQQPQTQPSSQAQQPQIVNRYCEEHRYYKKQLTKIFETYCQNITSK
ncbi:hypothetical protein E4O05_00275 [Treponema sp. OMZ 787]|uniref:hypothetical protein n=1 Tax=Treponema sp. OMZ 787 TaxID=2563669 RepID=UPI0020A414AF|nr:hypothetical protein [Treponema sp. OMZ 787]UTC62393.1 hypothetical protein E4O05_00275 [Treponema sp. OMZ 787]